MKRAAQQLESNLETNFIRATDYGDDDPAHDDYRNDPGWQGGNVYDDDDDYYTNFSEPPRGGTGFSN